jgi:HSP20 family protein
MEVKAMEALKFYQGTSPVLRSIFNDFWGDQCYQPVIRNHNTPLLNIKETENEFEITFAAPGFAKDDFNVSVEENVLTVSSEKKNDKEVTAEKGTYSRKEYSYQSFSRSLTLPQGKVDTQSISATYINGILTVMLPKKEEAKPQPVKLIEIK